MITRENVKQLIESIISLGSMNYVCDCKECQEQLIEIITDFINKKENRNEL